MMSILHKELERKVEKLIKHMTTMQEQSMSYLLILWVIRWVGEGEGGRGLLERGVNRGSAIAILIVNK